MKYHWGRKVSPSLYWHTLSNGVTEVILHVAATWCSWSKEQPSQANAPNVRKSMPSLWKSSQVYTILSLNQQQCCIDLPRSFHAFRRENVTLYGWDMQRIMLYKHRHALALPLNLKRTHFYAGLSTGTIHMPSANIPIFRFFANIHRTVWAYVPGLAHNARICLAEIDWEQQQHSCPCVKWIDACCILASCHPRTFTNISLPWNLQKSRRFQCPILCNQSWKNWQTIPCHSMESPGRWAVEQWSPHGCHLPLVYLPQPEQTSVSSAPNRWGPRGSLPVVWQGWWKPLQPNTARNAHTKSAFVPSP